MDRNEEGMKLVDGDIGTYDAIASLRDWLEKYGGTIDENGKLWFSNKPFTMDTVQPIGVLSKIFLF